MDHSGDHCIAAQAYGFRPGSAGLGSARQRSSWERRGKHLLLFIKLRLQQLLASRLSQLQREQMIFGTIVKGKEGVSPQKSVCGDVAIGNLRETPSLEHCDRPYGICAGQGNHSRVVL